jgi:hypothetical protein
MSLPYLRFWRAIFLGAVDALLVAVVFYLAEKLVGYVGWPRVSFVWVSISVLLILCFAPTSYVVHRLFARRFNSQIVLWLFIGVISICIWNGLFAAAVYWEIHQHDYWVLYYEMTNPRNPDFGFFSLALVVGTNLIFGLAMKTFSTRRATQLGAV